MENSILICFVLVVSIRAPPHWPECKILIFKIYIHLSWLFNFDIFLVSFIQESKISDDFCYL